MEGEGEVSPSIIDKLHSSDIERDHMEGQAGVTRSIIDELHSLDIERDETECESVLLELSLRKLNLWISKKIKWKLNMLLLEV